MSSRPSIRPLSPLLQEVACRGLNEDPKRREQDLAHIKEWLKKQPHLKTARTDDQWLLTFLRGCKFSLERTKEKLDTYYTMRTMLPEFFSNRDPMLPEIQEILKLGMHLPLPKHGDTAGRISLVRFSTCDANTMKIRTVIKVAFMILDILLLEDDAMIISGDIFVLDAVGVTMGHILQATPTVVKKIVTCFQDAFPNRPQEINFMNTPVIFQAILDLVLPFMKEKLKKRMSSCPDLPSLHKRLPKSVLPEEYGGEAGTLDELTAYWKQKVESYRKWFLEEENRKSDEKKRPGKPKTSGDMFGIEGSFRQFTLD